MEILRKYNIFVKINANQQRRLPIVVNVTVVVWLLLLGKLETLGSSFRHETRIFCEAAAVLYYYN